MTFQDRRLPVTVLSGFFGAGKTSLRAHMLRTSAERRVAVLIEEIGDANIEASLRCPKDVPRRDSAKPRIQPAHGCVCRPVREGLLMDLASLAREGRFDHLIVECTGLSEPRAVAEMFACEESEGVSLAALARLDTMITVVDASSFMDEWSAAANLEARGTGRAEDDGRTIADLLIEQVEFANVLLINKVDCVGLADVAELESILGHLNPGARILRARGGEAPSDQLLDTGLFAFEQVSRLRGCLAAARGRGPGPSQEYGITSFVYRARRPFHPRRIWDFMHADWSGLLRAKGFFWLATRPMIAGEWSRAGNACRVEPAGVWWIDTPQTIWPTAPAALQQIARNWCDGAGDRRQEIVIVGQRLDEAALRARLDVCLLTGAEMALGPDGWQRLADPFPVWEARYAEPMACDVGDASIRVS